MILEIFFIIISKIHVLCLYQHLEKSKSVDYTGEPRKIKETG
jgi:hypothetical protein